MWGVLDVHSVSENKSDSVVRCEEEGETDPSHLGPLQRGSPVTALTFQQFLKHVSDLSTALVKTDIYV
jgi:hypothetical protein